MKHRLVLLMFAAAMLNPALLAQAGPSPSALPAGAENVPAKMEFDTFMLVLLVRPPNAPEVTKEEGAELQEGHMANMKRLHAEGKLFKAGPTEDLSGRNVRGIFILKTDSLEIARTWVETDPAVKRGRLAPEFLRWYVEKGSLQ